MEHFFLETRKNVEKMVKPIPELAYTLAVMVAGVMCIPTLAYGGLQGWTVAHTIARDKTELGTCIVFAVVGAVARYLRLLSQIYICQQVGKVLLSLPRWDVSFNEPDHIKLFLACVAFGMVLVDQLLDFFFIS